jgi:predicted ATP-grasp superfamily ATP-dependent carboligase
VGGAKVERRRRPGVEAREGSRATVLVTDGEQRAALAVVRSLGRAGYRVVVASRRPPSLAGSSRRAGGEVVTPDPLADPGLFLEAIRDAVEDHGVDIVLPITDAAMIPLLERREVLAPARIPFPDVTAFRSASDKHAVMAAAAAVGIPVPEQRVASDREALEGQLDGLRYPVIVKPARSVAGDGRTRRKTAVTVAVDEADVRAAGAAVPPDAYPLLLQRRIVGPGTGVFLLRWGGETVAAFAHERIREKPPSGGVSVLRASVPLDPELVAASERLLDSLGWEGVAMLEYKRDSETGTPYLMEINPRFWGSLQLAVDAGVDFPALLVDRALGGSREAARSYRVGVRTRWLLGDLDHLLIRMRRSARELNLPPDAPGRLEVLADFLSSFRPGVRNEARRR